MKDTIYRQDAIDAFGLSEKTRKYGGDHSGYDTMMLYEIQNTLESLPSAQPSSSCAHENDQDLQPTCNQLATDSISRQAAIREYQEICKGIKCGECPFLIKVNTEKGSHLITDCKLEAFLHDLPSAQPDLSEYSDKLWRNAYERGKRDAQPERKKGLWIDKSDGIEGAWNYCSVCGEQAIDLYDFCPNCGADMRGEQDE